MSIEGRIPTPFHIVSIVLLIGLSSCASTPKLFESDFSPAQKMTQFVLMNPEEPQLAPGDKITVSIWGHDELSIGSINTPYMTNETTGRWVILDKEGEVNLPKIGRVNLKGFNVKEAAYFLEEKYAIHITDPVINVRIINHYVTVLGEVNKPGKYQMDNEALALVDLLGQTEGYTKYAKLDEVQLIRSIDGKKIKFTIDFSSLNNLNTQNASLKPGDIVYIPPTRRKDSDITLNRVIPVASVLTGIALVISSFTK